MVSSPLGGLSQRLRLNSEEVDVHCHHFEHRWDEEDNSRSREGFEKEVIETIQDHLLSNGDWNWPCL